MTTDAFDLLEQRNAELEAEKEALLLELAHTQGERDGAIKRAQVAEEERDALALRVERISAWWGGESKTKLDLGEFAQIIADQPEASLASRDAEQQAMGMDSLIPMVADGIGRTLDLSEDQIIEVEEWLGGRAELRREAEAEADAAGEGE